MREKTTQYSVKRETEKFVINFNVQDFFFKNENIISLIDCFVEDFYKTKLIATNQYYSVLKGYTEHLLDFKRSPVRSWLIKKLGIVDRIFTVGIEDSTDLKLFVTESSHENIYFLRDAGREFNIEEFKKIVKTKGFRFEDLLHLIENADFDSVNFIIYADDVGVVEIVGRIKDLEKTEQKVIEYFKDKDVVLEKKQNK